MPSITYTAKRPHYATTSVLWRGGGYHGYLYMLDVPDGTEVAVSWGETSAADVIETAARHIVGGKLTIGDLTAAATLALRDGSTEAMCALVLLSEALERAKHQIKEPDLDCVPSSEFTRVDTPEPEAATSEHTAIEDCVTWIDLTARKSVAENRLHSQEVAINGILARLETLESCAEVGTAAEVRRLRDRVAACEKQAAACMMRAYTAVERVSAIQRDGMDSGKQLESGINDLHRRVKALEGK